jgi:hypothetical protein
VPLPVEAKFSLPGWAFAVAINSGKVAALSLAELATSSGEAVTWVMGAKSFNAS